jgi:hypothetical protein
MKTRIFLLLPIVAIIIQRCVCRKALGCAENIYSFTIAAKAYPDKDSIAVSDTIWFEIDAPTIFLDGNSNIDYSKAGNLGTVVSATKLLGVNQAENSVLDFDYYLPIGVKLNENQFGIEYKFIETNNKYLFKLGLIPKKKGVYKIFVSNANNVFRADDKCTKANFTINFANTDQHFYFNKIAAPDITLTSPSGVYLFKVI